MTSHVVYTIELCLHGKWKRCSETYFGGSGTFCPMNQEFTSPEGAVSAFEQTNKWILRGAYDYWDTPIPRSQFRIIKTTITTEVVS